MRYAFKCERRHDPITFEVSAPMAEGPPSDVTCPTCGAAAIRVFHSTLVKYNAQGFHTTDYDKHGDKLERFNDNWSKKYGEKPPPPAEDVPRNAGEPY